MAVLVNLDLNMCRGGSCACPGATSRVVRLVFLPGRCPYTSSSVRLTGDLELYSGWCGGVLSARAPIVLGMASQCPRWWHNAEDGRTRPEVTEEMRLVYFISRRHPGCTLSRWLYAFEGVTVPFRWVWRGGRMGVGGTVPRSGHPAQHPHSTGDGSTVAGCSNSVGI
jgi:hypothetical protein